MGFSPVIGLISATVGNWPVGHCDERPLSGIGIQWQLFGDESEERTVNTRPKRVSHTIFTDDTILMESSRSNLGC
jgi:hypothetical protein